MSLAEQVKALEKRVVLAEGGYGNLRATLRLPRNRELLARGDQKAIADLLAYVDALEEGGPARPAPGCVYPHAETDAEVGRFQTAIRNTIAGWVEQLPEHHRREVDGGGCDSGDPLDLTLTEVQIGLAAAEDYIDELKGEVDRLRTKLRRQAESHESMAIVLRGGATPAGLQSCVSQCDKFAAEAREALSAPSPMLPPKSEAPR